MKNVLITAIVLWVSLCLGLAEEEHSVSDILDFTTLTGSVDTTINFPGSSLQITFQPRNISALRNAPAEFSVFAEGDQSLAYQWFRDGVPINGATAETLYIPHVEDSDLGVYTVGVTEGLYTLFSRPAALVYAQLIPVTVHPAAELEAFLEYGKFYQIQISEDLVNWQDLGSPVQGRGALRPFLQSTARLPASFFRIKVTDSIPGGPVSLAGRNFTFSTTEGVLQFVEFSPTTNTFRMNVFGPGRIGYDGTYSLTTDSSHGGLARLTISVPPTGSSLLYTMKFQTGSTGSVDLISVRTDSASFAQAGVAGGAASMASKHLTLNITKGVVTGAFQFDFTASDYTGTHGTDTLSGIYFYSLEGSVGDLSFHLPNLEVQDSYFLIFTSPGEFILRGSQRATDGSFGQVEGTGTLQ